MIRHKDGIHILNTGWGFNVEQVLIRRFGKFAIREKEGQTGRIPPTEGDMVMGAG